MQNDIQLQLISASLQDMLSKYPDNNIARCLIKLNGFAYHEDSLRNITLRKDKVMSFCPGGKPTLITNNDDGCNGVWSKENRQEGKYGKIIKKVLNEQMPRFDYIDKDLEELVNFLKSQVADGEFRIVSDDDIRHWYHQDNYESGTGSLASSCMRYDECQDYLSIYTDNSDLIQMVILVKGNMLLGRALLWDGKWMDRIYGSDDTIEKFKTYAMDNGYNRKYRQSYDDNTNWVDPDGNTFTNDSLSFSLNNYAYSNYPFVDTFFNFDDENGTLSNIRGDGNCRLVETGGGYSPQERYCEDEGGWHDESEMVMIDGLWYYSGYFYDDVQGGNILRDDSIQLRDGRYTHEDNDNVVEIEGDYYTTDQLTTCDYSNNQYPTDYTSFTYLEELEMDVHPDYVDDAYTDSGYVKDDEGNWYHEDDFDGDDPDIVLEDAA